MVYVLIREDGKFVTLPGSDHSYTDKLQYARSFASKDDAECEQCGNESVIECHNFFD